MKILIAGDTHCNILHFKDVLFPAALREGCDRIFVVGDFGYWPRDDAGLRFLKWLNKLSQECAIPVYWLDGNHDDHHALRDLKKPVLDAEGFWKIRPNIWYSPRGHRWTWGGVRFLSLGGAYSIDREVRVIGKSWFWEEMINPDDVAACGTDKVDVMLAHDVPAGLPMAEIMAGQGRGFYIIPEAYKNTMYVRDVVDAVNPEWFIHGHYHLKYQRMLDNDYTNVVGLSCDGAGKDSYAIVDLSFLNADPNT